MEKSSFRTMGYQTFWVISAVLLCAGLTFCSSGKKHQHKERFETGKIIPKVVCKKDISVSYALYLPSDYNEEKSWPVIFAFDAHAKGIKPVELFSQMAEKYGYILIGSNNSQNGMTTEETMNIYDLLNYDVLSRFSVDRARIYTAGFSGGSRVASSVAIFKGGICGVIGCSAGFPSISKPIPFKFDYIGFVGDEDMNYLEMTTLENALMQSDYRHQLIIFKGKHEWPPQEYIPDAFIWLEANAMKDNKKPKDIKWIHQTISEWKAKAGEYEKQDKLFEAYQIYKKIVNYFNGLTDMTSFTQKIASMEKLPEIMAGNQAAEKNRQTELEMQSQYLKALSEKKAEWWRAEVKKLRNQAEKTPDTEQSLIIRRTLNYLSLAAYSNSNALLNSGHTDEAARFIELYSIIDPQNNEHAYLAALVHTRKGETEKAFASLYKAIELGFNDYSRYKNDTVLARLSNDPRYAEIMELLKQKNP